MLESLANLFFPKVCYSCSHLLTDNELYICTLCRHKLPVTNFHFNDDDTVKRIFYGRVPVKYATALLRFEKKGLTQTLIHNLKYKGFEEIGLFLGNWLGSELKEIKAYSNIDLVIPVPLHKNKLQKRGYNQVTLFAKQIAKHINAEYVDDVLIKTTNTASQVSKSRISRWFNNPEIFQAVNTHKIENKHVLLVDDIITTGATLEACSNILLNTKNVKISIAAMAIA
ncbi:ComF family protein [Hanstruepera flava]|uniref:ComF family protein n=1 Tax=Hanstruepera flava TaxID=2930218 RepID=UPI0020289B9C|nr:phosphoribosyltransferase family protein [Hanstruepera flava]